jgi:hypothetical protein
MFELSTVFRYFDVRDFVIRVSVSSDIFYSGLCRIIFSVYKKFSRFCYTSFERFSNKIPNDSKFPQNTEHTENTENFCDFLKEINFPSTNDLKKHHF